MARLKLKDGVTYGEVGDVIARLAGEAQSGASLQNSQALEDFEELLDTSSEAVAGLALNEFVTSSLPTVNGDSVFVNLHIDRTLDHEGKKVRVVNVVVPDFNDKLTKIARQGGVVGVASTGDSQEELNEALADLSEVAKEAFGFIVICGCAG